MTKIKDLEKRIDNINNNVRGVYKALAERDADLERGIHKKCYYEYRDDDGTVHSYGWGSFSGDEIADSKLREDPKWSADGIALSELDDAEKYFTSQSDGRVCEHSCTGRYDSNISSNGFAFKTKERAELESDRQKVQYTMRKMACASRDDNDWRVGEERDFTICYDDTEPYPGFHIPRGNQTYHFNVVCFLFYEDAEKCLDHLLDEYGEERLKEIWGVK